MPADSALSEDTPRRATEGIPAWLAPLLVGAAVALGLAWSWLAWPDPQIDFGRELYVPWRLAQGDVLYRDIAYWTGPLSVYWHATLFAVFGTGLRTVVASNLAVLLLTLFFVFRIVRRLGDWLSALTACLVLIATSAFSQVVEIANYNFMSPYRHELTHGLLFGLIGLDCLARHASTGRTRWAAAAGLMLGLGWLTKIEIVLATTVALPLGLSLTMLAQPSTATARIRTLAAFTLAALVPLVLALGLLSTVMPAPHALAGLLGPFRATLSGSYTSSPFIQKGAGLDDPLGRLGTMGLSLLQVALGVGAVVLGARLWRGEARKPVLALASATLLLALWLLVPAKTSLHLAHALPLLVVLAAALLVARTRSARAPLLSVAVGALPMFAFSAALLVKMGLHPRTWHYGFLLSVPSLALVCTALVSWLPAALAAYRVQTAVLRAGAMVLVLSFGLTHLRYTERQLSTRIHALGEGADRMVGDVRAQTFEQLRVAIERHVPREATVTVVPEGVTLSYLTRRKSAIPYLELIPTEIAFFGEDRIRAALERTPPDFVVLVHRDTSQYGAIRFGHDYAKSLASFFSRHYTQYLALGDSGPKSDLRSRAVIFKRRDAPTAAATAP